jgi:hypothetical protein
LRALDGGLDLGARADDAGVGHQAFAVGVVEQGDLCRIEIGEGGAQGFALSEDGDPGQPRLEPVQHQLLPQGARVVLGHAPFRVVIGDVERVGSAPGAAMRGFGHGLILAAARRSRKRARLQINR